MYALTTTPPIASAPPRWRRRRRRRRCRPPRPSCCRACPSPCRAGRRRPPTALSTTGCAFSTSSPAASRALSSTGSAFAERSPVASFALSTTGSAFSTRPPAVSAGLARERRSPCRPPCRPDRRPLPFALSNDAGLVAALRLPVGSLHRSRPDLLHRAPRRCGVHRRERGARLQTPQVTDGSARRVVPQPVEACSSRSPARSDLEAVLDLVPRHQREAERAPASRSPGRGRPRRPRARARRRQGIRAPTRRSPTPGRRCRPPPSRAPRPGRPTATRARARDRGRRGSARCEPPSVVVVEHRSIASAAVERSPRRRRRGAGRAVRTRARHARARATVSARRRRMPTNSGGTMCRS